MKNARTAKLRQIGHWYRAHRPFGPNICVYCGEYADTEDHVAPIGHVSAMFLAKGQDARRSIKGLLRVPCCRECNSILGGFVAEDIDQKRRKVEAAIKSRYAGCLSALEWGASAISTLGPALRSFMENEIKKAQRIERRLKFLGGERDLVWRIPESKKPKARSVSSSHVQRFAAWCDRRRRMAEGTLDEAIQALREEEVTEDAA